MKLYFRIIIIICEALFLISCATKHLKESQDVYITKEQIIDRIKGVNSSYKTIKGYGKIKIKTNKQKKLDLNISLLLKDSKSLRLEALNFFNQPNYYLLVHNDMIISLDPINGLAVRAKLTNQNLKKITYSEINLQEWIKILSNEICTQIDPVKARVERIKNEYKIIHNSLIIKADNDFRIKEIRISELDVIIKYDNYKKVEDKIFPFDISYLENARNTLVELKWSEVIVDENINTSQFDLKIPDNYRITNLD